MQIKKLFKLMLLKLWVLLHAVFMASVFGGAAYFLEWNVPIAFLVGFFGHIYLTYTDEREWPHKDILNFPASTYLRKPPQQPPPDRSPHDVLP